MLGSISYFTIFFLLACSPREYVYDVASVTGQVIIDGRADEEEWEAATLLTDFSYPWKDITPPKTTFKAIHDEDYLYFFYYAEDEDIRLKQSGDEEMDAVASDRIEIFIKGAEDSQPYYSFEMDPQGRVFDSKGEFGKYIDKEFDYPMEGLAFKGDISNGFYTVEGSIRLSTLREFNLLADDGVVMIGLYRGEYLLEEKEEKTYWISWVIPDSETPNFHIPSSFGKFRLQ